MFTAIIGHIFLSGYSICITTRSFCPLSASVQIWQLMIQLWLKTYGISVLYLYAAVLWLELGKHKGCAGTQSGSKPHRLHSHWSVPLEQRIRAVALVVSLSLYPRAKWKKLNSCPHVKVFGIIFFFFNMKALHKFALQ